MEGMDNNAQAPAENTPPASPPASDPAPKATPAAEQTPKAAPTPPAKQPTGDPTPPAGDNKPPDWRIGLPKELKDALGDTDPAEAAAIYARGKDYKPALKAEDIALKLGKDEELHPGLEKMFKEMCVAQKMTPAQAQALVDFNSKLSAEAQRLYLEQGNAELEKRFGTDTDKVKDHALKMFANLDRAMDGRLSKSPSGKQIASDPMVVEALALIYRKIGEDSLGASAPSGGEDKAMSDTEFFEHVLGKQQQSARAAL